MKQYKGKLIPKTQELIKNNITQLKELLRKNKHGLNAPTSKMLTFEQSVKKYNKGITIEQIKAWVWYRRKQGVPMKNWHNYFVTDTTAILSNWVKNGVLYIDKGNYVPYAIFVFGNIYSKLSQLEKEKNFIIENFGNSVYINHKNILTQNKPKQLSISNPKQNERPVILAISKYVQNFKVSEVREQSGLIIEDQISMQHAFAKWLDTLTEDDLERKISAYQIKQYYLYGNSKPRSIDKIEWRSIQKYGREIGEKLFKRFLYQVLTHSDHLKIDAHYNMNYNAIAPLQYHKIPIGVEISKTFYGKELDIRPAQREAIAFMEMVGSGIIAYDVGVGKTISAIIEVASALQSGKCKRPLIVVPNPTYKNWIKETMEILKGTGIKFQQWYNLGADYENSIDFTKKIAENTITLVTYQGFQKLGLSDTDKLFNELSNILDQKKEKTKRDREKQNEKYRELLGVGNKGTIADVDVLGFDYVVIDEAHNFKNVFAEVKSDDQDPKKRFHIKGGKPSSRAIKSFFICNYIQRTYGKNVMLLTATPFTNSPLEIYSMLSLVAHSYMKQWNIYNIKDFFEQYILETTEYVVGIDGEIKEKTIVKSFNNRVSLQKLINSHINFKTGEEVNIPRPCKINLPKTTELTDNGVKRLPINQQITTYLKMSEQQAEIQQSINIQAAKPTSKDDPGKQLRLMSQSLNNALSPYIYYKTKPNDYHDFVNSSPKIKYTLDCIKTVKQWHEKRNQDVTGQVIYIDRGKDYFTYIKEYLEKELGFKRNVQLRSNPRQKVDEVEIITGEISNTKKEKIKVAFNDGTCKIIIGTSTIKEGINLQEKSTVLYNLYPNWNPTDIRQLEGRIWRQKNENGFVRVVMPLMENSMDVFVFQKLEEKTSRINDLWSKSDRGNVLDEQSLDPNEVKFALVTDLGVLTRFEVKQIKEELQRSINVLESNKKSLDNYEELKQSYQNKKANTRHSYKNELTRLDYIHLFDLNHDRIYFKDIITLAIKTLNKSQKEKLEKTQQTFNELSSIDIDNASDKEIIQAKAKLNRFRSETYDYNFNAYKDVVSRFIKLKKTIFDARGYDENTDLSIIKTEIEKDLLLAQTEYDEVKTTDFYDKIFKQIQDKKAKLKLKGGTLQSKVTDFAKLNLLLSYKFRDVDFSSCKIPTQENKVIPLKTNRTRKLRLAKAKAKALKLKLKLIA